MYGIVQSGIIAHTSLKEHLLPFRYEPAPVIMVLWDHNNNRVSFTLVINNFGIIYQRQEEAHRLTNALQEKYEVTQY